MSLMQAKQKVDIYTSIVGPGQFSWERYAMWLFEHFPELAAETLGEALRKSDS
jgi:predicted phosphoadenosine phosphosulfate sulfurtransferase